MVARSSATYFYIDIYKALADPEDIEAAIVEYIGMFYNHMRRHRYTDRLSSVEFEQRYSSRLEGVQRNVFWREVEVDCELTKFIAGAERP